EAFRQFFERNAGQGAIDPHFVDAQRCRHLRQRQGGSRNGFCSPCRLGRRSSRSGGHRARGGHCNSWRRSRRSRCWRSWRLGVESRVSQFQEIRSIGIIQLKFKGQKREVLRIVSSVPVEVALLVKLLVAV